MNQSLSKQINKWPSQTVRALAQVKSTDVKGTIQVLWAQEYDADPLLEPEYVGLTHGQAIIKRQIHQAVLGDGAATDRVLDRMIGKPEQVNKNLNIQGTYKEFLEEVARAEGGIIDVDAVSTTSD